MPKLLGKLFLWYLIIYLVVVKLRELIYADSLAEAFEEFASPHLFGLLIASGLAFLSYVLSSYLVLHRFYRRIPNWQLILTFILVVLGCMLLRAFLEEFVVYNIFGRGNYNRNMTWPIYLMDNVYYAIIFSSLGIVFFFIQFGSFKEEARRQSELLRRETELKFLRSQVNPHFLFNTLNNLYSLVATKSKQALPALDKLSGLLRYSLYDHAPLVSLDRETAYLEDLLELESLRVEGLVPPEVNFGPFSVDWQIPPLLLVPFVENAFKHGDLRNPDQPLNIVLQETSGGLHFRSENALRMQVNSQDQVGGIGLNNVRKRLELLYPGQYTLSIKDDGEKFVVDLLLNPQKHEA